MDLVSPSTAKAVAQRLKHYIDVQRREEGFDLSGHNTQMGGFSSASGGSYYFHNAQDKYLKYYTQQPLLKHHLEAMGLSRHAGTSRGSSSYKQKARHQRKSLSQNGTGTYKSSVKVTNAHDCNTLIHTTAQLVASYSEKTSKMVPSTESSKVPNEPKVIEVMPANREQEPLSPTQCLIDNEPSKLHTTLKTVNADAISCGVPLSIQSGHIAEENAGYSSSAVKINASMHSTGHETSQINSTPTVSPMLITTQQHVIPSKNHVIKTRGVEVQTDSVAKRDVGISVSVPCDACTQTPVDAEVQTDLHMHMITERSHGSSFGSKKKKAQSSCKDQEHGADSKYSENVCKQICFEDHRHVLKDQGKTEAHGSSQGMDSNLKVPVNLEMHPSKIGGNEVPHSSDSMLHIQLSHDRGIPEQKKQIENCQRDPSLEPCLEGSAEHFDNSTIKGKNVNSFSKTAGDQMDVMHAQPIECNSSLQQARNSHQNRSTIESHLKEKLEKQPTLDSLVQQELPKEISNPTCSKLPNEPVTVVHIIDTSNHEKNIEEINSDSKLDSSKKYLNGAQLRDDAARLRSISEVVLASGGRQQIIVQRKSEIKQRPRSSKEKTKNTVHKKLCKRSSDLNVNDSHDTKINENGHSVIKDSSDAICMDSAHNSNPKLECNQAEQMEVQCVMNTNGKHEHSAEREKESGCLKNDNTNLEGKTKESAMQETTAREKSACVKKEISTDSIARVTVSLEATAKNQKGIILPAEEMTIHGSALGEDKVLESTEKKENKQLQNESITYTVSLEDIRKDFVTNEQPVTRLEAKQEEKELECIEIKDKGLDSFTKENVTLQSTDQAQSKPEPEEREDKSAVKEELKPCISDKELIKVVVNASTEAPLLTLESKTEISKLEINSDPSEKLYTGIQHESAIKVDIASLSEREAREMDSSGVQPKDSVKVDISNIKTQDDETNKNKSSCETKTVKTSECNGDKMVEHEEPVKDETRVHLEEKTDSSMDRKNNLEPEPIKGTLQPEQMKDSAIKGEHVVKETENMLHSPATEQVKLNFEGNRGSKDSSIFQEQKNEHARRMSTDLENVYEAGKELKAHPEMKAEITSAKKEEMVSKSEAKEEKTTSTSQVLKIEPSIENVQEGSIENMNSINTQPVAKDRAEDTNILTKEKMMCSSVPNAGIKSPVRNEEQKSTFEEKKVDHRALENLVSAEAVKNQSESEQNDQTTVAMKDHNKPDCLCKEEISDNAKFEACISEKETERKEIKIQSQSKQEAKQKSAIEESVAENNLQMHLEIKQETNLHDKKSDFEHNEEMKQKNEVIGQDCTASPGTKLELAASEQKEAKTEQLKSEEDIQSKKSEVLGNTLENVQHKLDIKEPDCIVTEGIEPYSEGKVEKEPENKEKKKKLNLNYTDMEEKLNFASGNESSAKMNDEKTSAVEEKSLGKAGDGSEDTVMRDKEVDIQKEKEKNNESTVTEVQLTENEGSKITSKGRMNPDSVSAKLDITVKEGEQNSEAKKEMKSEHDCVETFAIGKTNHEQPVEENKSTNRPNENTALAEKCLETI